MLDESLPTFLLKPAEDKPKQNSIFFYSQHGSNYEANYLVRHLDPEQHLSKNRYAVGLYDAFTPDVLFGEVLLVPEWTQPSSSAEELRRTGGVPPPPEPILPMSFVIQLYNPDQQIKVTYRPASFTKDASWQFDMPQVTFREPSSSTLDRSQHDPVASDLTPKIRLKWTKDSKFSKDLTCYQSGRSLNPDGSKKKYKEPNITLALFRSLKEITLYETNFSRIDIEDIKGFEVVLLLGAVVIRDVYFAHMRDTFNLGMRRESNATSPPLSTVNPVENHAAAPQVPGREARIPPTDPLTQWQIEADTARLKQQADAEEREAQHRLHAEERRVRKLVEAEQKENRKAHEKRSQAIEQETERLRKLYGKEDSSVRPSLPTRPLIPSVDQRRPSSYQSSHPQQQVPWDHHLQHGVSPYVNGAAAQSSYLSPVTDQEQQQRLKPKSSIFSFGRRREEDVNKLSKKRSAVF